MKRSLGTSRLPRACQKEGLRKSAEVYLGGTGTWSVVSSPRSSARWASQVVCHSANLRSPESLRRYAARYGTASALRISTRLVRTPAWRLVDDSSRAWARLVGSLAGVWWGRGSGGPPWRGGRASWPTGGGSGGWDGGGGYPWGPSPGSGFPSRSRIQAARASRPRSFPGVEDQRPLCW